MIAYSILLISCCDKIETHTKQTVTYSWKDFTLSHDTSAKFRVEDAETAECENLRGSEYSCLRASFTLRRQLGYYFIRVYGPSILIVMMTFAGFWMPIQWLPARVSCFPVLDIELNEPDDADKRTRLAPTDAGHATKSS